MKHKTQRNLIRNTSLFLINTANYKYSVNSFKHNKIYSKFLHKHKNETHIVNKL